MIQYNAEAIEILNGLEPIRRRPGMYTNTSRPNHLAQEVIDNSIDEVLASYANNITVILYEDQSLEVIDDGRGLPVDIHPKKNISAVEVIFGNLHTGGKFSNKLYPFSGGLHGVGIAVVNALSKRLEVKIMRKRKIYQIVFAYGKKIKELHIIGNCAKGITGTSIRFWPDSNFFDNSNFSIPHLLHILKAKAVLLSGVKIIFKDNINKIEKNWCYKDGLKNYLMEAVNSCTFLPKKGFSGTFSGENNIIDWVLLWLPEGGELLTESYVNLIPTIHGGTHINGLRQGLLDAIKEFCENRNLLPRGLKLDSHDIFDRCAYILSLKIKDPQFSGQTKERLSSRDSGKFVFKIIKNMFTIWLNKNTKEAEKIAEFFIATAQKRSKILKKIAFKNSIGYLTLPGKLANCISKNIHCTELFLVEGDSAGGSAKQARDREYQAILPLRGKILNTWEISSDAILHSHEVHDISMAIGILPGSDDLSTLRYGKICFLSDADSDGLHITTLLCALFFRHFFALIKAGYIYISMPPLYRIDLGKEIYYAFDETEKYALLNKFSLKRDKLNIQRFKGLGEMNPSQLRETTFLPHTRRLIQLIIHQDNYKKTLAMMDMLLSKRRSEDRRNWLQNRGNSISIEL
ncbi:MAG: DNA topoisomerase IV subunit B [Arsenophonus sp.]|nr:MAG: DNA topoisomerase IV subunit B [Arsenophonus sp.]